MTLTYALLMLLHFAYHLVATVGVFYSLWHSNKVHRPALWKIIAAVFWLVVSVLMMIEVAHGH